MTTRWFEEPYGWRPDDEDPDLIPGWHRMATEEPGRTTLVRTPRPRSRSSAGPSLYGLRQAYLAAGDAVAAGEALLAFLAALSAVRAVSDLDALTEACTGPGRDPAVDVAGLATAVLAVAAFYGLVVAAVTGHLALAAALCVLVLAAAGLLRHVAPVRRARRR